MKIMETVRLGTGGKTVSVVKHHGGHHIRIEGSDAVLMPEFLPSRSSVDGAQKRVRLDCARHGAMSAVIVYRAINGDLAWMVVIEQYVQPAKAGLRRDGIPAIAVIRRRRSKASTEEYE